MLQAYGCPLSMVSSFKFLVRILMVNDDNWAAVISNLRKLQKRWAKMLQILVWYGDNVRLYSLFYKSMDQAILIYGL